jgi:two-component system, OmpR family, sensor histidine kinase KdpD
MGSCLSAEAPLLDLQAPYGPVVMQKAWRTSTEESRPDAFGPKSWIRTWVHPVGMAVGFVAMTTVGLMFVAVKFPIGHVSSVYLIPVLICATQWGLVPALIASALGVAASDFFFIPPLYAFSIDSSEDVIDLVLLGCVAVVTSQLAARLRHEVGKSQQQEADVSDLYRFSRRLMTTSSAAEIYASIEEHLSKALGAKTLVLGASQQNKRDLPELSQVDLPPAIRDEAKLLLQASTIQPKVVDDAQTGHLWMLKAMSPSTADLGIVAIDLGIRSRNAIGSIERNIDSFLADAIATLERLDVSRLISEANVRTQAEALREALIGSVSHELRTPLSSILGAATVMLRAGPVKGDPKLSRLGQMIRDEAEQLNNDIQNLLDAARVSTATVQPHLEWVDLVDVVNAALDRKQRLVADHEVAVTLVCDMPMIQMDPVLVGQALGQFIENAAKYSPSGSTIHISGRVEQGRAMISVADEGSGLSEDEKGRIWLRSYRGAKHANRIAGAGLGLWIAQAFVKANGGEVTASSEGFGHGTTVTMSFPVPRDTLGELAHDDE